MTTVTQPAGANLFCVCLLLFLSCVVLYNLNHRYLGTTDTAPNVYLPVSIILHGDLYLDRYPTLPGTRDEKPPYFLQRSRGRLVSSYPVLPAVLAVPVYLGPMLWLHGRGISYDSQTFFDTCVFCAKLAASVIAAASVVLVFLTLAGFIDRRKALALACLYAFGTAAFPIASQALWGHGAAMLFLSLAAYLWLHHPGRVVALAAALGLAVAARPSATVVVAIFTIFLAVGEPRKLPLFLLPPSIIGIALAVSNLYFYGAAHGGYVQIFAQVSDRQQMPSAWTTSIGEGLAGLLVSPSRGLLVFSPFLALAFFGLYRTFRDSHWARWRPLSLSVLALLLLYSCYSTWWGGMGYGPRYLSESCPYLVLLLAPVLPAIEKSSARRLGFQVLAAAGIFVQTMGAMLWTGDWYATPTNVDIDHARLWDWKDSEITRTLRQYSLRATPPANPSAGADRRP